MMIIRAFNKGISEDISKGRILTRAGNFECRFGKNGITTRKVEGDNKSPMGAFKLARVFWRAERIAKPQTGLPATPITKQLGWCDDPKSPLYNRLVKLPFSARCEKLWRKDNRYDVVVVVEYNFDPPIKNKGSAIFIHPSNNATAGCIGMNLTDLVKLLRTIHCKTLLKIG